MIEEELNRIISNSKDDSNNSLFEFSRWTSDAYQVRFSEMRGVITNDDNRSEFIHSGWGLSSLVHEIVADFPGATITESIAWIIENQSERIGEILWQLQVSPHHGQKLEQIYIAISCEMFLPNGLRTYVTCVTNIVPRGSIANGMDKFVAVLDPGEAQLYIAERKGLTSTLPGEKLH